MTRTENEMAKYSCIGVFKAVVYYSRIEVREGTSSQKVGDKILSTSDVEEVTRTVLKE